MTTNVLSMAESGRHAIRSARRIVVKVGSSSLTCPGDGLDSARLEKLVEALVTRQQAGSQVILVSSGAIAAGLAPLGLSRRPRDVATLQAAASVGQGLLIERYTVAFARYGLRVGQVLLTVHDLHRLVQYRNARRTLDRLLGLGVTPIINENDAVVTDEIRFGDNDRLAALTAHLVQADALVLLSDVDGLYDGDPGTEDARLLSEVRGRSELGQVRLGRARPSAVGTGGINSKLDAIRMTTEAGIPVLLASAEQVNEALSEAYVGTFFYPQPQRITSRMFWLRNATTPQGSLVLDDGAVEAIVRRRLSLLPAGITSVLGDFTAGDPVQLLTPGGVAVARGLVAYDATELPDLLGRSTRDLAPEYRREVVHRDDIVLLPDFSV